MYGISEKKYSQNQEDLLLVSCLILQKLLQTHRENFFVSQFCLGIMAHLGKADLEYRDGKAYIKPQEADPLGIGEFEIDLPQDKMNKLAFAFGGQPVFCGNEKPLPIVGIKIPGGPSFDLFDSIGIDKSALKDGKLVYKKPQIPRNDMQKHSIPTTLSEEKGNI